MKNPIFKVKVLVKKITIFFLVFNLFGFAKSYAINGEKKEQVLQMLKEARSLTSEAIRILECPRGECGLRTCIIQTRFIEYEGTDVGDVEAILAARKKCKTQGAVSSEVCATAPVKNCFESLQ